MDSQELRETFHRVNAYRSVTAVVRASAGHSFFSGLLFLVIAYFTFQITGPYNPFFLIYCSLGILEVSVAFWKRLAPSVECILADSIFNLAFAMSILVRQGLIWQGMLPGVINPVSLFFAALALRDSYKAFSAYLEFRKHFVERPTASQMRYVADMIADIRRGDPDSDPSMLDFSRELDFKAQMLGELAFLVDHSGEVHVLDKNDLLINRVNDSPLAHVVLFNNPLRPIQLRESNWQNYCRWKGVPVT